MGRRKANPAPPIKTTIRMLACGHEHWWELNATAGCIHPAHGPYPPARVALPPSKLYAKSTNRK